MALMPSIKWNPEQCGHIQSRLKQCLGSLCPRPEQCQVCAADGNEPGCHLLVSRKALSRTPYPALPSYYLGLGSAAKIPQGNGAERRPLGTRAARWAQRHLGFPSCLPHPVLPEDAPGPRTRMRSEVTGVCLGLERRRQTKPHLDCPRFLSSDERLIRPGMGQQRGMFCLSHL